MEILFDSENLTSEGVIAALPSPYKATFVKETMKKEYTVSGITCMGCVHSIRTSIENLEGLEDYTVDHENSMLYIEFDIEKTDDKKILSKIPEKFKVVDIINKIYTKNRNKKDFKKILVKLPMKKTEGEIKNQLMNFDKLYKYFK